MENINQSLMKGSMDDLQKNIPFPNLLIYKNIAKKDKERFNRDFFSWNEK